MQWRVTPVHLFALINELRGKGQPDEISLRGLSTAHPDSPPAPNWIRWGKVPDQMLTTPWGTAASMDSYLSPPNIMGVAAVLRVPPSTVGRAVLESVGIPGMFADDALDAAVAKLPVGWWNTGEQHLRHLRRTAEVLIADREHEAEAERLAGENDELRARVAELEAAADPKPARRTRRP
jgi:hypothetical protein